MAPITEEIVSGLKDTIGKLEARVVELEDRLAGGKQSKSLAEQMRIILMGPPGAGKAVVLVGVGAELMIFQARALKRRTSRTSSARATW
jgi:hypothetical protein